MKIAVLVDSEGKTSGFEKDGVIRVYSKVGEEWVSEKNIEYSVKNIENAAMLRDKIKEISNWMADCKILVVKRIRDMYYIAFEQHQVSMLEIIGEPQEFLNEVKACFQHQRVGTAVPMEHNAIHELHPGYFHTDLTEVMKGNTSYNSKQILLPFMKNNTYNCLEIICDHVPKWLDQELPVLKLMLSVEKYKNCMKVKIYPEKLM